MLEGDLASKKWSLIVTNDNLLYRSKVHITLGLLHQANDEGWMRSLDYFCRLKALYFNGVVYNYSMRKLGELLKVSPTTIKHHILVLEKKGLIAYEGKNIRFLGYRKLMLLSRSESSNLGCSKPIGLRIIDGSFLLSMRGYLLIQNIRQQEYRIKQGIHPRLRKRYKSNLIKDTDTVNFRAFYKLQPISDSKRESIKSHDLGRSFEHSGFKEIVSATGMSSRSYGKMLGLSRSSGSRILSRLEGEGMIKTDRLYRILEEGVSIKGFYDMRRLGLIPSYSKFKGGLIYREVFKQIKIA